MEGPRSRRRRTTPDRSSDGRGTMAARVELREISNEEGNRLLQIVRRGNGSVVTWRRAQIVLLAAQRMPAARIGQAVRSWKRSVGGRRMTPAAYALRFGSSVRLLGTRSR